MLSFSDRVSKIMGENLLKSHTMLSTSCSICGSILMRHPKTGEYCIGCDLLNETQKTEVEEEKSKDPQIFSIDDQVSKVMGERLLLGHIMLGTYCTNCQSIQMRNPHTGEYCIKCDILSHQNNKEPIPEKLKTNNHSKMIVDKRENLVSHVENICDEKIFKYEDDKIVSIKVLMEKINWATVQMSSCEDLVKLNQLSSLINNCANAISTLKLI